MHKTRVRIYSCLNKLISIKQMRFMHWFNLLINFNVLRSEYPHEAWIKLPNDMHMKAMHLHANTAFESVICTGRISKRTASCCMLLLLKSIIFGTELLLSRFFWWYFFNTRKAWITFRSEYECRAGLNWLHIKRHLGTSNGKHIPGMDLR